MATAHCLPEAAAMDVENPVAAAPITPPRLGGWIASVTAGLVVVLAAAVLVYVTSRIVNGVDRTTLETHTKTAVEEHRDQAWRRFEDHEKRISEAERTGRESRNLLIELRTKIDIVIDRLAPSVATR